MSSTGSGFARCPSCNKIHPLQPPPFPHLTSFAPIRCSCGHGFVVTKLPPPDLPTGNCKSCGQRMAFDSEAENWLHIDSGSQFCGLEGVR